MLFLFFKFDVREDNRSSDFTSLNLKATVWETLIQRCERLCDILLIVAREAQRAWWCHAILSIVIVDSNHSCFRIIVFTWSSIFDRYQRSLTKLFLTIFASVRGQNRNTIIFILLAVFVLAVEIWWVHWLVATAIDHQVFVVVLLALFILGPSTSNFKFVVAFFLVIIIKRDLNITVIWWTALLATDRLRNLHFLDSAQLFWSAKTFIECHNWIVDTLLDIFHNEATARLFLLLHFWNKFHAFFVWVTILKHYLRIKLFFVSDKIFLIDKWNTVAYICVWYNIQIYPTQSESKFKHKSSLMGFWGFGVLGF